MSYQVGLGQSLKNMMQSDGKSENDFSIFTNDISLILDRGPMIGYIWSHAPPWYSSNSHLIYCAHAPATCKRLLITFANSFDRDQDQNVGPALDADC